ncbi:cupredoxin domain-containing protein [Halospeciosus flavus]|nr:plastocyanin/azurin family copper-binding protein [Halospeciosus flavus]
MADQNTGDDASDRLAPRRRQLLTALGAAAIPTVAGCSASNSQTTTTSTSTQTTTMQTTKQQDAESIDPRFGYIGTAGESKPVEPDHTVNLVFRPRQDAWIPEFFFEPTGLKIDVGDTVQFNIATPHHNVNAYHPGFGYNQRVPDGVPAFSSPILTPGDYWLYTFETEGVHDIMCAPHEVYGMVGRIVVGSATGPGAKSVGEAPGSEHSRPPEFTAALVLSSPPMQPDNIASKGTVKWGDIPAEDKKPLLKPVQQEG